MAHDKPSAANDMKHTRTHTPPLQSIPSVAAWLMLAIAVLGSCTGGGRVQPSTEQTDHPTLSAQERWAMADRSLTPGTYAPFVRLPFLFAQGQDAEQRLDSINHAAHILLFWASWCSDCHEETPALLYQLSYFRITSLVIRTSCEEEETRTPTPRGTTTSQ